MCNAEPAKVFQICDLIVFPEINGECLQNETVEFSVRRCCYGLRPAVDKAAGNPDHAPYSLTS